MIDDEPSEEERREAEALARALAGERTQPGATEPPEDALVGAALVRFGQDGGLLANDRIRAVEKRLLSGLPKRSRQPTRWLVPAAALAAAAAVVVTVMVGRELRDGAALPSPDVALLQAQARAGKGDATAARELEMAMRDHRARVYAALAQRYQEER